MILERAINDEDMCERLITLFNDKDENNIQALATAINSLPNIGKLKHKPQVINKEIGTEIVKLFEQMRLVPTLFFVDPFGYKGLSLRLINSVLNNWGCDCIFFFNYNRINMGLNNEAVKSHMDALFNDEADELRTQLEQLNPEEREFAIVEALAQALKSMGGEFVLPFRFVNARGTRTSHHLVFVSKHFKGYETMKNVMASESSSLEQGVPSFEYNPATIRQPLLFELNKPLDELAAMLLTEFAGQTLTMYKLYEKHNIGRRFIKKNYKEVLSQLENEGKITVDKHRKGTFADHLKVTFPPRSR